jgi:hypothetical protein
MDLLRGREVVRQGRNIKKKPWKTLSRQDKSQELSYRHHGGGYPRLRTEKRILLLPFPIPLSLSLSLPHPYHIVERQTKKVYQGPERDFLQLL